MVCIEMSVAVGAFLLALIYIADAIRDLYKRRKEDGRKAIKFRSIEHCIDLMRQWEETGVLADVLYCVLSVIAEIIGY